MSNKYGIPEKDERDIRARDGKCVYCRKEMVAPRDSARRKDWATIEHLNRLPPWDNPHTVAICCGSCNSSRRDTELLAWFKMRYCTASNINTKTVSAPVREYVGYIEDFLNRQNWIFAKTMPETPHYYVVRDSLPDDDKKRFDALDEYIKQNGYTAVFVSKEYYYLNVGDWKYWIIGTILNRALIKHEN
ncbi:MAG TPA: hypothetical protein VI957_03905 [Candidatus Paceibacterota bacterium]